MKRCADDNPFGGQPESLGNATAAVGGAASRVIQAKNKSQTRTAPTIRRTRSWISELLASRSSCALRQREQMGRRPGGCSVAMMYSVGTSQAQTRQ